MDTLSKPWAVAPCSGDEAAEASASLGGVVDRALEAFGRDVGVDRGGAGVGVAGELADDLDRLPGFGEVGAEGVAQDVRGSAVFGELGELSVAGDDPGDVADGERRWR